MAMTLAQMRSRIRKAVDDVARKRWDADGNNTDVDGAIAIAAVEALNVAVNAGSTRFRVTETFSSTSNGVVDLASVRPLRIHAVRVASGAAPHQGFDEILPLGQSGFTSLHPFVETLSITYTPAPVVDEMVSDSVVWGADVDAPELDALTCMLAASSMKVDEGEENPALERRKAELMRAVQTMPDVMTWTVSPGASGRWGYPRSFFWVLSGASTLQLVER